MLANPDFDTMTMTEARVFVAKFVDDMTEHFASHFASRSAAREVAIQSCRESWADEAARASFSFGVTDDNRTTYYPMLLTALDELEVRS